jgi:hypothetical protein
MLVGTQLVHHAGHPFTTLDYNLPELSLHKNSVWQNGASPTESDTTHTHTSLAQFPPRRCVPSARLPALRPNATLQIQRLHLPRDTHLRAARRNPVGCHGSEF